MAHLQQLAAAPHRANNPPRSFQGVGHFLFEIDIQPRLQAANRMVSMPEVRAGDDRGIEIFFGGEHLAVILISVQFVSVFLQQAIGAQLVVFGPDITHRPEAQTGDLQAGAEQHLPLGPGADQRNVQLIAGGGPPRPAQHVSGKDGDRRSGRRRLGNKFPPGDFFSR